MTGDPLQAAAERARSDQTCEEARDTARHIAAFHDELTRASLPTPLADDLTREYALKMLDANDRDDDDGDED